MIEFLSKGGILMIPLLLCSVFAFAIIFERFYFLRKARIDTDNFMSRIKKVVMANRIMEALSICENTPGPIANLLKAGIEKHEKAKEEIKDAIEDASVQEIPKLERYLPTLATIANISPLLGLLGTVTGMIKAFNVMSIQGTGNPTALAGGIAEALITTATGLSIAIPSLVFYNYLVNKVNNFVIDMEVRSAELVEILTRREKAEFKLDWEKI